MQLNSGSDFPLTLATLLVAIVALFTAVFGPYLSELVRERFRAPRLAMWWEEVTPHCIKTFFGAPFTNDNAVYYFRFRAANEGEAQARLCEAVLENLWTCDAAGNARPYPNFAPRNLGIETDRPLQPISINPHKRWLYCAIGHVSSPDYQAKYETGKLQDIKDNLDPKLLRFALEGKSITHGQPVLLGPGKYTIQVTLFSENASPTSGFFTITWSGNWQTEPTAMFNECVIQYSSLSP